MLSLYIITQWVGFLCIFSLNPDYYNILFTPRVIHSLLINRISHSQAMTTLNKSTVQFYCTINLARSSFSQRLGDKCDKHG